MLFRSKGLLQNKRNEIQRVRGQYVVGLEKLGSASSQVLQCLLCCLVVLCGLMATFIFLKVAEMQAELKELQPKLVIAQADNLRMMEQVYMYMFYF